MTAVNSVLLSIYLQMVQFECHFGIFGPLLWQYHFANENGFYQFFRNDFSLYPCFICEISNVLKRYIFCINLIIMKTFEAQTFYCQTITEQTLIECFIFNVNGITNTTGSILLLVYCFTKSSSHYVFNVIFKFGLPLQNICTSQKKTHVFTLALASLSSSLLFLECDIIELNLSQNL